MAIVPFGGDGGALASGSAVDPVVPANSYEQLQGVDGTRRLVQLIVGSGGASFTGTAEPE